MNNIIKYDLKGQYKKFSILYIIGLVLSFVCTFYVKMVNPTEQSDSLGFASLIIIIIIISTIVFCIRDFSSDIYDDRSYLTFTLPISGQQFLCSKLINYLIWMTISILVCGLMVFLNLKLIATNEQIFNFKSPLGILNMLSHIDYLVVLINLINLVFAAMFFILNIYFYMILSRATNVNQKLSKFMSIILLIIFVSLMGYGYGKMGKIINKNLVISSHGIKIINGSLNKINYNIINYASIDIGSAIFSIILFILMFTLGSYLLNKRIDIK